MEGDGTAGNRISLFSLSLLNVERRRVDLNQHKKVLPKEMDDLICFA
jgi:hypothetical protein